MSPPAAKRVPREIAMHGDTRMDEYYWLRDRNNPDTIAYLEAENQYTASAMEPAADLQEKLYNEILGRIKEDDTSVPVRKDAWFYYTRTERGQPYGISCRKYASLRAPEEILLDANLLAAGRNYFRIGAFSVSPRHNLLAYSIDSAGDEAYTVYVKDLRTGALLSDSIVNTYDTLEWANDNATFFYTVLDEAKRPYRVYRHVLGFKTDELIYEEQDARFWMGLSKSRSGRFIYIELHSKLTSEIRYVRASDPLSELRVVLPRVQGVEYGLADHGEYFYIRTNHSAKSFRLMRTAIDAPSDTNWEEVIPERVGITIERVDTFESFLVLSERDRGLPGIRVSPLSDPAPNPADDFHYIGFPEPAYSAGLTGNLEYRSSTLRFAYTSLIAPPSVFDYNVDTRERELKKQTEVLGGYDPSLYGSERIFAMAGDGVAVPISVVYRKDTALDGTSPMLLYGYGSYGLTMDPGFSSDRLSLLDRGFVYAIAHIRGGGELGKPWHDDGKLLRKKNTFSDFIACAEHLIAQRYTSADRLTILGGSAGGLLVGAVLNMCPELFHAAIAKVPFVDVVNTMLDPTLPLTIPEYEEWGNPEDKRYYDYIRSYSPYDNVEPKAYPALLITAGLNDPRVSYWEPAKWAARLRAVKTDGNVLLLKTNMGAGHFGPSGRYDRLRETAFDYAFLLAIPGRGSVT